MKILWLLFVLHTACAQTGFGRSYLRNSRLCHQWSCVNNKLGLPDSLPPSEDFKNVLHALLPSGQWQDVVDRVVHTCYNDRPRRYTNTCPGQALLQCTVDQLVNNCPEESLRKDDACAPVNSLAGLSNMFTQSRYENLERNMPLERRPTWFLRNYFNSKCCNLPQLFNSSVLKECGFDTMMQYYKHDPQFESKPVYRSQNFDTPVIFHYTATEASHGDESANTVRIVNLNDIKPEVMPEINMNMPTPDPLSCCDMSEFIDPKWRQNCGFQLEWSARRLSVKESDLSLTTTTAAPERTVTHRDLMVLPQTCEQETCVFNKLNITRSGSVDIEAFKKLLDSLTDSKPDWNRAKARVLTTCLRKRLDYVADCEINKILACTFDVLTENCPVSESTPKHDPCKHSKDDRVCQISSSKSRPKHRRSVCTLPELVEKSVLSECGINSLSRVEETVQTVTKPKPYSYASWRHKCLDLTPSTSCLLTKMGVLNKYSFMDYFQMKDRIRRFGENNEWSNLLDVYLSAFTNNPLYREYCNSAKKFLNVVDSMLLTCPTSKRNTSPQCTKLFQDITNTPTDANATKEHKAQALNHFHHLFFPSTSFKPTQHTTKILKKPIYNYGVLSSAYVPKVEVIEIKPKEKKPLVLLPVYMRMSHNLALTPSLNDEKKALRASLAANNWVTQAYVYTTPVPTSPVFTTPISTSPVFTTPIPTTPVFTTPIPTTPVFTTPIPTTPVFTTPIPTTPIPTTPAFTTPSSTSVS